MIDAQPSSATVASLIVLVTGHLVVDGNVEQPMPYSQMFQCLGLNERTNERTRDSKGRRKPGEHARRNAPGKGQGQVGKRALWDGWGCYNVKWRIA
ncbi:hypothetical protein QFC21_000641 [Naganishia friedmannii]|uniref:Uncharacterized protein n=1 Tax=Naganishia friedmannii TaxID=89922 RepID=A0ACC2WCD5_9TREE|nr:hypothetical protein QFC21_000641 [Naganishia friedmannii]